MKKSLLLLFLLPLSVAAQVDSLGQWPFLFWYNFPTTCDDSVGINYPAGGCCDNEVPPDYIRSSPEYATFMHTDDIIRIVGLACMHSPAIDDVIYTLYTDEMEPIVSVIVQNFENYGQNAPPGYKFLASRNMRHNPPAFKLQFFENDSVIDICGDFWIGARRPALGHMPRLAYLHERHQPPYHFQPWSFRLYFDESKEWETYTANRSVPMLSPIIIPPCVGVDSVRTWVDSTGCLHAEWDSLRWQEQWVVALRTDGLEQPLYDTVDSCRWSYCGLDSGAAYNVSVQSRCWNPGDRYTWSPFSHRAGTLGIVAQPAAPAAPALHLSPNPAKDRVRVECNAEIQTLSVVDAMGRTLISQCEPLIDIRHLPAGVYTVVAATAQGPTSARLVVE